MRMANGADVAISNSAVPYVVSITAKDKAGNAIVAGRPSCRNTCY